MYLQMLLGAIAKSPTFDEILHATRGYVFLTTGDWRMQMNLHPPFIHLLVGALMWFVFPHIDPQHLSSWTVLPLRHFDLAKEVVAALGYPSAFVPVFFGRVVVLGISIVLGALLFRWARSWYGTEAGLLALGFFAFAPNILAHGGLITTDMPVVMTFFLAAYALQRLVAQPSYRTILLTGVSLGLALGAKISAVILVPFFALVIVPWVKNPNWLRPLNPNHQSRRIQDLPIVWLCGTGVIALLTLWSIYGFEIGSYLDGWPALPLPTYVKTLVTTFGSFYRIPNAPPAFLGGQRSLSGWWYYFPVTLFLKTPLPILVGSLVGVGRLFHERRWWQLWFGSLLPVVYFAMALLNSWNLGYRYILPVEPFIILSIAPALKVFQSRRILRISGVILCIWLMVGTVRICPHYLAYFNEVAGGPANGYRFLTDSNLDWGQDLSQLSQYMDETGIERVYLSYFGSEKPEAYGIEYIPLPSFLPLEHERQFPIYAPEPGFYAISVTHLSGQYLSNPSTYDWFRRRLPIAQVGYSIHVYHVASSANSVLRKVGICYASGDFEMPDISDLLRGFGEQVAQASVLVCDDATILDEFEWIVIPASETYLVQALDGRNWDLIFQQTDFEGNPRFSVYQNLLKH